MTEYQKKRDQIEAALQQMRAATRAKTHARWRRRAVALTIALRKQEQEQEQEQGR